MTAVHRDPAVGVPLDGDLAWAIASWGGPDRETPLSREDIESLTRYLTDMGFTRPKSMDLSMSDARLFLSKLRNTAADLIGDEFLKGSRA